jgi:hypothetical protein
MALVIQTNRGWLNVDAYFCEAPERWGLLVGSAADYLELSAATIERELRAGHALADICRSQRKHVDVLKGRIAAAFLLAETSLGAVLHQLVEQVVDLPVFEPAADLAG